jgi:hypothetical protein
MASTLVAAVTAAAQDSPSTLPWFMITVRPEFGAGGGNVDLDWNSGGRFGHHDEKPAIQGAGWGGLAIEPFFLPTSGRGFIISPLLSFGRGSGTFNNVGTNVDGQNVMYSQWLMAVGLGYQWYFGATKATSLYLMGHLGGGQVTLAVDDRGGWQTSNPMAMGYLDVTIGALHRWRNGFVLGGAMILSGENFDSYDVPTNSGNFWNVGATGNIAMWRLGVMLGYALH